MYIYVYNMFLFFGFLDKFTFFKIKKILHRSTIFPGMVSFEEGIALFWSTSLL